MFGGGVIHIVGSNGESLFGGAGVVVLRVSYCCFI